MTSIPVHVQHYFAHKNEVPAEQAANLFYELESFLRRADKRDLTPTKEVDEAWHAFILHTKDYSEWCSTQIGRFIHHVPFAPEDDAIAASCSRACSSNCQGCKSS